MNIAFIPVRGGSKSIPLKNIKELNGKPLVYWTIKAAEEANVERAQKKEGCQSLGRYAKKLKEVESVEINAQTEFTLIEKLSIK